MKAPKKSLLISTLICSFWTVNGQKAFDEFYALKNFQPFLFYTAKALPTAAADVTVTVNYSQVKNNIRQSLFGQNSAAFLGNSPTLGVRETNWKNAGLSLYRYPGGNWANQFFWDGNIPSSILYESTIKGNVGGLFKGTTDWMMETDEFPSFLNMMGGKGIICVNVGYAFYGTSANPVNNAADYAAQWVKFYNVDMKAGVKYWELGNENYGPWQAGFDLGSPQKYGDACKIFAQKMKAIDPTIKIGVNFFEGNGGFNKPQGKNWNELVLPIVKDIMDFAIIHHYPHPESNRNAITEKVIYDDVSEVSETIEWFHNQTVTYAGKPAGFYPIAITEYNARTGVREISRTNTLFTTMMLGEYASYNDYAAATQWDLQNGYTVGLGDHGMTSKGDPFMLDGSPNPSYFAHYYMNKYFGNQLLSSTSNNVDIKVYPTKFSSGEMGVVIVNKGNTDKTVELNLGTFKKGQRMYWHTVNGDDSDFDRTIYINDQGPETTFNVGQTYINGTRSQVATALEANGVGGPANFASVKPYSALIPTSGNTKFRAPKYSASYIVFETNTSRPYKGTSISIPGVIEAEEYDNGGQGVAYNDNDATNLGGVFRNDGVDVVAITGGHVVGHTGIGEWLEYSINVTQNTVYDFNFLLASPSGTGSISVNLDGNPLISSFNSPNTGAWTSYQTVLKLATLPVGNHIIRVNILNTGLNVDKITITKSLANTIENDGSISKVSVFPNPSNTGEFIISDKKEWILYSSLGIEILSGNGDFIDIKRYPKGIYYLKLDDSTIKLIHE